MFDGASDLRSGERKALETLIGSGEALTKGELARQVFGEVTGSTQAMVTRITQALEARGFIEERQDGRFRRVTVTDAGRQASLAPAEPAPPFSRSSLLQLRIDEPAGRSRPVQSNPPKARNIKHLHGAAVLVAHHLSRRSEWSPTDKRFAQAMLVLIDELPGEAENARHDLIRMHSLVGTWPRTDLWRAGLVEILALIEIPEERSINPTGLATELLRLAGECLSTAETALLWSAGTGSILGALKSADHATSELRSNLVEALRLSLRKAQVVDQSMARYWRARSLAALGSFAAARYDWPRLNKFLDFDPDDQLSVTATGVVRDVLASGEINVRLLDLERVESEVLLPRVEDRHRKLPASELESIDAIFDDIEGWSRVWNEERQRLVLECTPLRLANDAVCSLPDDLPKTVSALPVAVEHAFRCGSQQFSEHERIADGDLKENVQRQVLDNLWSKSMVVGYVAALHGRDLIYRNRLS